MINDFLTFYAYNTYYCLMLVAGAVGGIMIQAIRPIYRNSALALRIVVSFFRGCVDAALVIFLYLVISIALFGEPKIDSHGIVFFGTITFILGVLLGGIGGIMWTLLDEFYVKKKVVKNKNKLFVFFLVQIIFLLRFTSFAFSWGSLTHINKNAFEAATVTEPDLRDAHFRE